MRLTIALLKVAMPRSVPTWSNGAPCGGARPQARLSRRRAALGTRAGRAAGRPLRGPARIYAHGRLGRRLHRRLRLCRRRYSRAACCVCVVPQVLCPGIGSEFHDVLCPGERARPSAAHCGGISCIPDPRGLHARYLAPSITIHGQPSARTRCTRPRNAEDGARIRLRSRSVWGVLAEKRRTPFFFKDGHSKTIFRYRGCGRGRSCARSSKTRNVSPAGPGHESQPGLR